MKILIYTPFWGRPEIVAEYVKSIQRLKEHADITLLAILSPEDTNFSDVLDLLPRDTHIVTTPNNPFGAKKNAGLKFARWLEWDYMMELNSDSMVNCEIIDLYKPYMEKKVPFFGLNNLYAVDWYTKKTIFVPDYNHGMSYGAGQMLHRDALKGDLWTAMYNDGMDTDKIKRLRGWGIPEVVVDCRARPMIVELKTNTTINHFKMLERWGAEVPFKIVEDVVTCS